MKIKLHLLSKFNKLGLSTQLYVVLALACTFCGNTKLLNYVMIMLVLMIVTMLMSFVFRRIGKDVIINKVNKNIPILLGVFTVFLIIQSYFAYNKEITRTYAFRYLIFTVLLLVIMKDHVYGFLISVFKAYSWIAGISSLLMTAINGTKSGGILGNYQAVGMMMSIACIIFAIDYFQEKKGISNLLGYLMALACVFVSGKRTFALLSILCLVGMFICTTDKNKVWKGVKITLFLLMGMIGLYVMFSPVRELFDRVIELSAGKNVYTMTSGRSGMWEVAMKMFESNKWFGVGFANFAVYTGEFFGKESWSGLFLTHNIYYGLLSETGVVGFVLFLSFMLYSLIWSICRFKKYNSLLSLTQKRILYYSVFVQTWFILYGFSGNGIYDSNESFFYVTAIAMALSVIQAKNQIQVY